MIKSQISLFRSVFSIEIEKAQRTVPYTDYSFLILIYMYDEI